MSNRGEINSISARLVYSDRGYPGIESTVTTNDGATGTAVAIGGTSTGEHEAALVHDDTDYWRGYGVNRAIYNVQEVIQPVLLGMDARDQERIDNTLLEIDGTPNKSKLGANATSSVSAAVLKAGAASKGEALYKHIGDKNIYKLPVPGVLLAMGSGRYGSLGFSGVKPSYACMCYGFNSFHEASHAAWLIFYEYSKMITKAYDMETCLSEKIIIPKGKIKNDLELYDIFCEVIFKLGYEGKVGIQVDVAATTYFDANKQKYVGLFSPEEKTKADLIHYYEKIVKDYPFVIIEDPLEENDFSGHAFLTKTLGIQVVGDDLYATDMKRVEKGVKTDATNTVLLKVNQIGTISEAFRMVRYAQNKGMAVMPCASRGEGVAIADYTVGLNTGQLREGALGPIGNRLMAIEAELGDKAEFTGEETLKIKNKKNS